MGRVESNLHPAVLWEENGDGTVQCNLCAHRCVIQPGAVGICAVRRNVDGALLSRVYGRSTSLAVDPIEKKPLFHFHPGSKALSMATVGCNFCCDHCQNHSISQWPRDAGHQEAVPGRRRSPEQIVAAARETGSEVIAYTYTEPTIYMEYALDTARLADAQGIKNVFVTNGYMTAEAVELIAPHLHGANVDLKGTDDRMLRREVKAECGPVMRTIRDLHARGIFVEVTTLVVPGSNDEKRQLRQIAEFIADVDPEMPWHVSRFHPVFRRMDRPATPEATILSALELGAAAGLRHIYPGNVWGADHESTCCPDCQTVVIERRGYTLGRIKLQGGRCQACGYRISGRGLP